MYSFIKRVRMSLAALSGFLFVLSVFLLVPFKASAAEPSLTEFLYYDQLTSEAKRFYAAIGEMDERGLLKKGNAEYDLVSNGTLTASQLESYSRTPDVMVAFGAARDAYSLDHPEVFYIDFSYLSVSVGMKDGSYTATLGTGRADNYYIPGGFENEAEVNEAVAEFDAAVASIVAEANAAGESAEEKIRVANARLVEKTEYDFCSTADENGTTYFDGAAFIRNPYGALVKGKSVCEGYARAFKTIMDALDVPCVLVQGYARTAESGGYEPHMWNYVQVDGHWYGADPTWNDTTGSVNGYLLCGNSLMKLEHIPDGEISENGFSFRYPALTPYDYGVSEDADGLTVEGKYEGDPANLIFRISYNGKGAERLAEEDGLYLSYRYSYEQDGSPVWIDWLFFCEMTGGLDFGTYTEFRGTNTYMQYIQFCLIDYAPDTDPVSDGNNKYSYNSDKLTDKHIRNVSEPYGNATYGTYAAPPYIKSVTPANMAMIKVAQTYTVTVVYTENLKKEDATQPVSVGFISRSPDAKDFAEISDVVWNESQPDTISFRFRPSQMYQHRYESYSFYLVNLVGAESEKAPMLVTYLTEQESVVCNRVFGDGRLYIKSYGKPSLVGTGDLSLDGWTDEQGNFVAENRRSQLMLVTTRPSENQSADMLDGAAKNAGVDKKDVLASETYELQLDICGQITRIPNGSYMQLAFGFPAGYGPDDAGVTFKVYHFKRDENGNIDPDKTEELDCVITEYGIVVTVTDFSPFAVLVLPKDEADSESKSIYARTVGFGGGMEGSGIAKLSENGSVSYTFLPDAGYRVDRVLLNGNVVEISENSIAFTYSELSENNTLEAYFVSERVAEREEREGIAPVYPSLKVLPADGTVEPAPVAPVNPVTSDGSADPWLIFLIVGICVVAATAIVVTVFVLNKRRGKNGK